MNWESVGWGVFVLAIFGLVYVQIKGGGIGSALGRLVNRPKDGGTSTKRK